MKTYVQYGKNGNVTGTVTSSLSAPSHPRQVEIAADAPSVLGKCYVPALGEFYDPRTHCLNGGKIEERSDIIVDDSANEAKRLLETDPSALANNTDIAKMMHLILKRLY